MKQVWIRHKVRFNGVDEGEERMVRVEDAEEWKKEDLVSIIRGPTSKEKDNDSDSEKEEERKQGSEASGK